MSNKRVFGSIALAASLFGLLLLGGCQNANTMAMQVGKPPDSALNLRVLQSRRFDTTNRLLKKSLGSQTKPESSPQWM